MSEIVKLEWTYTPEDFFEEPYIKNVGDYEFYIHEGKAIVSLSDALYDQDQSIKNRIFEELDGIFLGSQVINRKTYELSRESIDCRINEDGKRDITINVPCAHFSITAYPADIEITDASGKIIKSTKQERINSINNFANRVWQHFIHNPTLKRILVSHRNASSDPKNELIHLYEIRDALVREFGKERKTRKNLGIDKKKWSRFGQLANDLPLKEGRHRGNADEALRNASKEELNEARAFAKKIIESYLDYLDKNS